MTRIFAIGAALLAAVAVGIASYAAVTHDGSKTVVREVTVSGGTPTAATSVASAASVFQSANKGVVEITVSTSSSPYGGQAQAQGSGFVYDGAGHIVTNEHVVEGENSISVRFWNGATYKASLVGTDPSTDVAVIKLNAPASVLHPISLGNSSVLQVGQPVVAIGSPYGLENTVTAGIVSALHREMTAPNNFTIPDSIQTDAPINHGNSGGPLFDARGRVIGINAQIRSQSGQAEGVGFAVPINSARRSMEQLIANGSVSYAYVGVETTDLTPALGRRFGYAVLQGAVVTGLQPGSPAVKAGLRADSSRAQAFGVVFPRNGDVIVAIDGQRVAGSEDIARIVTNMSPGEIAHFTVQRGHSRLDLPLRLGERSETH